MKIHGQNLRDIIRRMPWQYQILVVAGAGFILMTVVYIASILIHFKKDVHAHAAQPVKISFMSPPASVFDPSLAARPGGGTAWMAYTVQQTAGDDGALDVRLASADTLSGCRLWGEQPQGGVFSKGGHILAPDGQTVLAKGTWRAQTPTLVYDPDDKGKQWKLFAFKYFWANKKQDRWPIVQHYGVITYSYTADPSKDDWSTEEWLFAAKKNYPPAPYDQMVMLDLDRLSPQLSDIVMYARPSAVYENGVLAMTLSAFKQGETSPDRVILIVSRDNGNSWAYAGTLLDKKDLSAFDVKGKPPYTRIFGATLLDQEGQVYLAAALGNAHQMGAGTLLLPFDDLAAGKLQINPQTGTPAVARRIPLPVPAGAIGGGTAAYTDSCPQTGVMISVQKGTSPYLTIYQTGKPPVGKAP